MEVNFSFHTLVGPGRALQARAPLEDVHRTRARGQLGPCHIRERTLVRRARPQDSVSSYEPRWIHA